MGESSSSPSPPNLRPEQNVSTRGLEPFREAMVPGGGLSSRQAWAIAVATDAERPRRSARGYRIYAVGGDGVSGRDLTAHDGAFLVLGRHTCCDLVIDRDPTASLRHLLLRLQPDEGAFALRVLDLRTQTGFCLHDGTTRRAILVRGPVLLRVGSYWIAALTNEGASGAEPPASVYELGAHPYRDAPPARPGRTYERPRLLSRVTVLPPASSLGDAPGRGPLASEYVLELDSADGVARVGVLRDELERGVFVGRSERCPDPRLRALLPRSISRVHLLIVRAGERVVAYDVASTQGTRVEGRRIRFAVLDDGGTDLLLGHEPPVLLRWRVRPSCAP